MTFSPSRRDRIHVRPSPVFLAVVAVAVAGGVIAWRAGGRLDTDSGRIGVFLLVLGGWVVTVCLHEFAHAYLAFRCGDQEAEARGYLTLNPLKFSHPLVSIVLPLAFIALGGIGLPGGAVYVHTAWMRPRTRLAISLIGPFVNLLCAVVLLAVIANRGLDDPHRQFWFGLSFLAFLQVMATVLNLLPIPGLDGYGALEPYLSPDTRRSLARFAPFGLLAVFAILSIRPLNTAFFDAIYWLFELSGVPRSFSQLGYALMKFWN